ncbi:MAG: caspase family protein [Ignavibacteriaceae bacterium]|nr:caspase family protein [Ignavibacteriaceae bacterium]
MKSLIRILLIFSAILYTTGFVAQDQPSAKRSLIIAIGNYPYLGFLNSANDVPLIKTALESQGFTDFRILTDSSATLSNILARLDELAADTRRGDIAVIHFSGHGQSIPDDNGDEPDGVDESFCAYGAKPWVTDDYHGEEHLRDDVFGRYIDKIREAAGPEGQVLVILDACYSGSGTRATDIITRGVDNVLTERNSPKDFTIKDETALYPAGVTLNESGFAPLIVFSGARANEKNAEYKGAGSLSYAFNKALTNPRGSDISYRGLFAEINSVMTGIAPAQNPVAEGNGLDLKIFGQGYIEPPASYPVTDIINDTLIIGAGTIAGIHPGARAVFYPAGTTDTSKTAPLFTGEVVFSHPLFAKVKPDFKPANFGGAAYTACITEAVVALDTVRIWYGGASGNSDTETLKKALGTSSLIRFVKENEWHDLAVTKSAGANLYTLTEISSGTVLADSLRIGDELTTRIRQYLISRQFAMLDLKNERIALEIELIPVTYDSKTGKTEEIADINKYYVNGVFTAGKSDFFKIKIRNTGKIRAYFNIMSIEENGKIDLLIPYVRKNEDPSGYFIKPGDEFIIPNFLYRFRNKSGKPVANEILKVIASAEPIDLRYALLKRRGDDPGEKKGQSSVLEEIFGLADDSQRSGPLKALRNEMISTYTFTIRKVK